MLLLLHEQRTSGLVRSKLNFDWFDGVQGCYAAVTNFTWPYMISITVTSLVISLLQVSAFRSLLLLRLL